MATIEPNPREKYWRYWRPAQQWQGVFFYGHELPPGVTEIRTVVETATQCLLVAWKRYGEWEPVGKLDWNASLEDAIKYIGLVARLNRNNHADPAGQKSDCP